MMTDETEREALAKLISGAPFPSQRSLAKADAILAAGFTRLSESEIRRDQAEIRPYDEATDHEYGAWETDDLEEHARDMLAVVRHRRAQQFTPTPTPETLPPEGPIEMHRDPVCAARWPEAETFGYDPRCCRFPKSCSATTEEPPVVNVIVDTPQGPANAQAMTVSAEEQADIHHNQLRYAELNKLRRGEANLYNESRYRN